jgi:hypothetical protein
MTQSIPSSPNYRKVMHTRSKRREGGRMILQPRSPDLSGVLSSNIRDLDLLSASAAVPGLEPVVALAEHQLASLARQAQLQDPLRTVLVSGARLLPPHPTL